MTINFEKFQGTGNDFILLDNRNGKYANLTAEVVKKMCHRNFGVGADGLMLLNLKANFDFEMLYFNPDGSSGMMCGNGGRCIVAFAKRIGIIDRHAHFLAADGEHFAEILESGEVKLKMNDSSVSTDENGVFLANTGAPHYVLNTQNINTLDVKFEGKAIRYSDRFKVSGINVNFLEILSDSKIFVRTYERGVEDETLSCGTGVTASALAFAEQLCLNKGAVSVQTLGGLLSVFFEKYDLKYSEIYLQGPAEYVFSGSIEI